ncbi:hypothetical protein DL93DRAFT_2070141 [Clavulina sp. PMI_390]|nr:hypothetical protein DL93DRAFT_2070141 [Clavulina sp. PMI_390]
MGVDTLSPQAAAIIKPANGPVTAKPGLQWMGVEITALIGVAFFLPLIIANLVYVALDYTLWWWLWW